VLAAVDVVVTNLADAPEWSRGRALAVTLIHSEALVPELHADRHEVVLVADTSNPLDPTGPKDRHVEALLALPGVPTLVHCHAGVSRSGAAAYALACRDLPERDPREIMSKMPATLRPNRLFVEIADRLLGRGGLMVEACAERHRVYVPRYAVAEIRLNRK